MGSTPARVSISYVFALRPADRVDEWLQRVADLNPLIVVREQAVTVVSIESPHRYEATPGVSRHQLIDADLERLRVAHPEVGGFHPHLDGTAVGTRWPIVAVVDDSAAIGPEVTTVEAGWDNALIAQADEATAARLVRLIALTLARYRVLQWCIEACRDLLIELREPRFEQDGLDRGSRSLRQVRDDAVIARILTDPRASIYWSCEQRLVEGLYSAWSMAEIEQSAADAITTTATFLEERRARTAASSVRRATVALITLTLISGVSSVAGLIDFSGSEVQLSWSWGARGYIAAGMAVAFVVLLVLVRARLSGTSDKTSA